MSASKIPTFARGKTALVSGGASGIGLALATKCAGYGMNVVIVDNNAKNLETAKQLLDSKGEGRVEGVELDVSQIGEWEKLKKLVEGEFDGKISLLALNAGIGGKGTWGDASYFNKILSVNLFGVLNGINTLLPLVTSSTPSSIIITGSKQGITNPPGNPAYNASKSAVKTVAEHLHYDLTKSSPDTSVHLLIPGWTFTGLSGNDPFAGEGKKEKPTGAWTGEQVVEFLEEKMEEKQFYILCPDGDVSEETDRKRILWGVGDLVNGRPPLTRWREEFKEESSEWMAKQKI